MTLDRTTTPPVGTFPPLSLPAPGIHALSNGIEIIACNRGDEDVCRIDIMLEGGYYTEQKPGRDRGGNVPKGGVVVRSNVIIFRVE